MEHHNKFAQSNRDLKIVKSKMCKELRDKYYACVGLDYNKKICKGLKKNAEDCF